jgi:hypothetical protein
VRESQRVSDLHRPAAIRMNQAVISWMSSGASCSSDRGREAVPVLDLQRLSKLQRLSGEVSQDTDWLGRLEVGRERSASVSDGSKLVEDVGVVVPGPGGRRDSGIGLDRHLEREGVDAGFEGVGRGGRLLLAGGWGRSEESPVVMDEEVGMMMGSSRGAVKGGKNCQRCSSEATAPSM